MEDLCTRIKHKNWRHSEHFGYDTVLKELKNTSKGPHFVPWVSLDLWELEFRVIWIHTFDFLTGWGPKNLNKGYILKNAIPILYKLWTK